MTTPTFTHLPDLLLVDIHSILVDVRLQEVLEAVLDLGPCASHGHPLPHRVALHVLKVLNHLRTLSEKAGEGGERRWKRGREKVGKEGERGGGRR